jgi:hypothetical protein
MSTSAQDRTAPETAHVVSAEQHAAELRNQSQALTAKEKLSSYMTIAAAAFGLISDGCKLFDGLDLHTATNFD